jgi:hypothetical protein
MLLESGARVCPEEANTTQKKLLQRPTSLEIPDFSGVDEWSLLLFVCWFSAIWTELFDIFGFPNQFELRTIMH